MEWGGAGSDPRPHLELRRRAEAGRRERRWRSEGCGGGAGAWEEARLEAVVELEGRAGVYL